MAAKKTKKSKIVYKYRTVTTKVRASRAGKGWRKVDWILVPITTFISGVNAAVGKDIEYAIGQGTWGKLDLLNKMSFIFSKISGRMIGMPWSVKQTDGATLQIVQPASISPIGAVNKWTIGGLILSAYSKYGDGFPLRREAKLVGAGSLIGGIFGIFDPVPTSPTQTVNVTAYSTGVN